MPRGTDNNVFKHFLDELEHGDDDFALNEHIDDHARNNVYDDRCPYCRAAVNAARTSDNRED